MGVPFSLYCAHFSSRYPLRSPLPSSPSRFTLHFPPFQPPTSTHGAFDLTLISPPASYAVLPAIFAGGSAKHGRTNAPSRPSPLPSHAYGNISRPRISKGTDEGVCALFPLPQILIAYLGLLFPPLNNDITLLSHPSRLARAIIDFSLIATPVAFSIDWRTGRSPQFYFFRSCTHQTNDGDRRLDCPFVPPNRMYDNRNPLPPRLHAFF